MIETEKQRRWWFATHPEYSHSASGRKKAHKKDDEESDKPLPEEVDAWADRNLSRTADPFFQTAYQSLKTLFGTEFESKSPKEQRELLRIDGHDDEEEEEEEEEEQLRPMPTFAGQAAPGDGYNKYENIPDNIVLEYGKAQEHGFRENWDLFKWRAMKQGWTVEQAKRVWDQIEQERAIYAPIPFIEETLDNFSPWGRVKGAILSAVKKVSKRRPARLPPKGTPEYAKIKKAREKGVEAKKAQELEDILAGGKGSGVWTEEELTWIRRDKEFPIDTRWHHDPTVANRPDLAHDPKVVHPLRGGTEGHFRDGHGGISWGHPPKK